MTAQENVYNKECRKAYLFSTVYGILFGSMKNDTNERKQAKPRMKPANFSSMKKQTTSDYYRMPWQNLINIQSLVQKGENNAIVQQWSTLEMQSTTE